jgi:hypothetical protein
MESSLNDWVRDIDVEELAAMIDTTPPGVSGDAHNPGFLYTAWQRISMLYWAKTPFDVTSSVKVEGDAMIQLINYRQGEARTRKMPFSAEMCMLAGSFPDKGIIDIPTAGGKTGWSIAVAYMAVASTNFPHLRQAYRTARLSTVYQGPPCMPVARIVIIATGASTFHHFVNTAMRSIPNFRAMEHSSVTFHLWTTIGAQTSIEIAASAGENNIFFWVVPVSKLNTILRMSPSTAVAVCITDEFTIDTPRERFLSSKSPVVKHMITQATPHALQDATSRGRTWLKDMMGGKMHAPCDIHNLLRTRNFNEAQIAIQQLCILDIITLAPFRERIRSDLEHLMPSHLQIHFVISKPLTLSAFILRSEADILPVSFCNVVLNLVRPFLPTTDSVILFRQEVENTALAPSAIVGALDRLITTHPSSNAQVIQRLIKRINEFTTACPICFNVCSGMQVYGCCGYCVCDECFGRANMRCAFCRTVVPTSYKRADIECPIETERSEDVSVDYPPTPIFQDNVNFESNLKNVVARDAKQIANLTLTLHTLVFHGFSRILLLVEKSMFTIGEAGNYISLTRISNVTGIRTVGVDSQLKGKGKEFAETKKQFDTTTGPPIALATFGMDENFLVGTNLDFADSIVTVGNIPSLLITQALARTFRPRKSRDNARPIVLVKLFTNMGTQR